MQHWNDFDGSSCVHTGRGLRSSDFGFSYVGGQSVWEFPKIRALFVGPYCKDPTI